MHLLLWYGEPNWTGYSGTERLNDLIVGQIGSMNWLKWDREAKLICYSGLHKVNEQATGGQMDWLK